MQNVTDIIDINLLNTVPPRALPIGTVVSLVGQRVASLASRVLLDPVLILGVTGVWGLTMLELPLVALVLAIVLAIHMVLRWHSAVRTVMQDVALLRHGRVVRAYVLRAKTVHTHDGQIGGIFLDCAIPLSQRRTHIGSVWLSDGAAGMEIARRGRVRVLCLPFAPGVWRLLEGGYAEIRSSSTLTEAQRALMREW